MIYATCQQTECSEVGVAKPTARLGDVDVDVVVICGECGDPCELIEEEE